MVHSKDATLNNSHVPGPDSMMPEGKKKNQGEKFKNVSQNTFLFYLVL